MLYLTADSFPVFVPSGVIGFYRYLWYLIRIAASFTYRPIPLPLNPTYNTAEDVTIIVLAIDAGAEFKEAARSWLANSPKEILIITEERMLAPLANSVDPTKIRVLTVPFANKRHMEFGIPYIRISLFSRTTMRFGRPLFWVAFLRVLKIRKWAVWVRVSLLVNV
ncbi:hypothetical protein MPER_04555 [Moniliophthora perniciosa FA553]|nr:hypothetical protein MPER_04555 [Moniliophthora perniciosa FA553]